MSYPDITLTGEDIHQAFNAAEHPVEGQAKSWDEISELAQKKYNKMAVELNRELNARLAWFEVGDSNA